MFTVCFLSSAMRRQPLSRALVAKGEIWKNYQVGESLQFTVMVKLFIDHYSYGAQQFISC
ncbi:hypothetical protein FKN12_17765 [Vibrio sp. 2-2(8)]|nr:hypothetical protein [Vibrio sp. 2-2(8)]